MKNTSVRIIELLKNGNLQDAELKIKGLAATHDYEEILITAEEAMELGFYDHSIPLYEALLKGYPNEGELIVTLAELYLEQDREEDALQLLSQVKQDDDMYASALLLEADLYQIQGLSEVAEQKLTKAKISLPNEPIIDFALAELYYQEGRFGRAIESYKKVREKHSKLAGVSIDQRLAESYSNSGQFEEALPYYESAIEDKTELNTLFEYGFTAYQAGYPTKAIQLLTELKNMDHEFHSLYVPLASAYEQMEELDQALTTLEQGIKVDEFNKELFFKAGKLALKRHKKDDAIEYLRQAIALDPGYLEASLTLIKIFQHEEQYEEVVETIDSIRKYGDDDPQFDWMLASAYQHLEQFSQSLKHYEEAYNFFKTNPEFLEDYGYFLLEEGKFDQAGEIFNKLLEMDPSNEEFIQVVERLGEN
ncbi:tetratricopeptide repeat protein [Peribacillus alkalitolerans]|uniref:tetratricopeptide repeat protein n=1 Tax=Peribacillus alkalitolerans TaxID=1550385 RepID=UPI0013D2668C|nr:tetratricopeptide repeat protein [Peribacillus alkalitolerans]